MATELADLNERIRERARKELKAEIDKTAKPFEDYLRTGYAWKTGLCTPGNDTDLNHWQVIDRLKEGIFKLLVAEREQEAIDDFLEKVDGLQVQIDDLKNSANHEG